MSDAFHMLGIPSTLRANSFNTGLLRAAQDVAPEGVTIEIFPIHTLPFYDQDLEGSDSEPASVREFREAIRRADALLITNAEYSHSVTGVLKNALDWASRPLPNHPLKFKSAALISATGGISGGIRSKLAILPVLEATETFLMMRPELMIGSAREKFDTDGNLKDDALRARLGQVVAALVDFSRQMRAIAS
ncbi:MAG: NADPH-dependent FMN reductase [Chloroflexota bacterium]